MILMFFDLMSVVNLSVMWIVFLADIRQCK